MGSVNKVLYCIVLYCIVLYCIVLYCIVLYCIVLYCIVYYSLTFNSDDMSVLSFVNSITINDIKLPHQSMQTWFRSVLVDRDRVISSLCPEHLKMFTCRF